LTGNAEKNSFDLEIEGDIGVFLDRDGTINRADPGEYITKWMNFEFLPGALEGISLLASLPIMIFVVTNQSAIYRDLMTHGDLEHIHGMMEFEIVSAGGRIDSIKYCPHTPRDKCACRKPSSLLYEELAREYSIDLSKSYNIGDHTRDMEAGQKANMINILVRTGHGITSEAELATQNVRVDFIVDNLKMAADTIANLISCK